MYTESSRADCEVTSENALAERHEDGNCEDESSEDEHDNHFTEQDYDCNNGQTTDNLDNQQFL